MKRPLQALLISPNPDMRRAITQGVKQITIREGQRDYTPGPAALFCHLAPWAVMVDIIDVHHRVLADVTIEECQADGFADLDDLLKGLKRFYPLINYLSWVTIIRWENVRGTFVDLPTLHESHLANIKKML